MSPPPQGPQGWSRSHARGRPELGSPGPGHSTEGSTVQLGVLLAARGPLLQAVGAVGDVGLAGALSVRGREAGRQEQALVLPARLFTQARVHHGGHRQQLDVRVGVGHRVPPHAAALLQVGLPLLLRQWGQSCLVQGPAEGGRRAGVAQDRDLGPDPGVASGCKRQTGKGCHWGGVTAVQNRCLRLGEEGGGGSKSRNSLRYRPSGRSGRNPTCCSCSNACACWTRPQPPLPPEQGAQKAFQDASHSRAFPLFLSCLLSFTAFTLCFLSASLL